jgi:NlpC/P60 family putative phage cell wall peptidase
MGLAVVTFSNNDIELRNRIIGIAKSWVGTPYHHQASLKGVGCDCFGLIRGIWRELYDDTDPETPPPYTWDWAETKSEESMLIAARKHLIEIDSKDAIGGDIFIFRYKQGYNAKHSVILTSRTTMIHAINGSSVCEVNLQDWWIRRIAAAFKFHTVLPQ